MSGIGDIHGYRLYTAKLVCFPTAVPVPATSPMYSYLEIFSQNITAGV
jgi:hypothetical protein